MHAFTKPEPRDDLEWETFESYIENDGTLNFADWQAMRAQQMRDRDQERAADHWEDQRS